MKKEKHLWNVREYESISLDLFSRELTVRELDGRPYSETKVLSVVESFKFLINLKKNVFASIAQHEKELAEIKMAASLVSELEFVTNVLAHATHEAEYEIFGKGESIKQVDTFLSIILKKALPLP